MKLVLKFLCYVFSLFLLINRRHRLVNSLRSSWTTRIAVAYGLYLLFKAFKPRQCIKGKLILVTGGARGIGKEIALELARREARVVLWDRDSEALKLAVSEVENNGGSCWGDTVDVSDHDQVHKAAQQLEETMGPLWGLINNAGVIGKGLSLVQTGDDEVIRTMNVNFLGNVWALKEFLPGMIARNEGHVVAVASLGGLVSSPGMSIYSASKAAVISLMECVRLELRKNHCFHVGTTIVCPGHVLTDLFSGFQTNPLVPSLRPEFVAKKVVEGMQRKWPQVTLPLLGNLVLFNKAVLPPHVCDLLSELTGVSNCMDTFRGRQEASS